ncbi:MAG: hypothetical protein NZ651_05785 [Candidatus Bipolaricaulota bacterium]|nr:hypothetical protein [Candidatus Bipolaricaulota bacterium]MDW8127265.1 hypothetical protein [Candidatus Bipolaricaulota bacterium]
MNELRAEVGKDGHKATAKLVKLLEHGGALVFPALRAWSEDKDREVRKVMAQAVAKAVDPRDPFRALFLFELIAPLLWDADPKIRALARRILRAKLIPAYPEEALEILAQWATEDQKKRVLAAQCLARLPAPMAKRAFILLRNMVRSEDEKVQRAALRSLRVWQTRNPAAVAAELRHWASDPELAKLVPFLGF